MVAFRPDPTVIGEVRLDDGALPTAAADFNGDGRDDLVVFREGMVASNKRIKNGFVAILPTFPGGTFAAPIFVTKDVDPYGADVE